MTALSNTALSPARPIRPLTDAEIDHVVGAYSYEGEAATAAGLMANDWANTYGSGSVHYYGNMGNEIPGGWNADYGYSGATWAVISTVEYTEFWGPCCTSDISKIFTR